MGSELLGTIVREGLFLVVMIATLIITPSLLVGLVVSTFQAATQINEQTLSFLPRFLITMMAILFIGPFIVKRLLEFVTLIITNIPYIIH